MGGFEMSRGTRLQCAPHRAMTAPPLGPPRRRTLEGRAVAEPEPCRLVPPPPPPPSLPPRVAATGTVMLASTALICCCTAMLRLGSLTCRRRTSRRGQRVKVNACQNGPGPHGTHDVQEHTRHAATPAKEHEPQASAAPQRGNLPNTRQKHFRRSRRSGPSGPAAAPPHPQPPAPTPRLEVAKESKRGGAA